MQPREKKLAIAVSVLLALTVVSWLYGAARQQFDRRHAQIDGLREEVSKRELNIRRGEHAARRRAEWLRQSLPADRQLARSLYQNWLLSQVEQAGLKEVDLSSQVAGSRRGVYDRLAFSVTGRGTLEELTRFLHAFHQADHLHQLRRLNIKPIERTNRLELSIAVEALLLPDAQNTALSSEPSDRLQHGPLESYTGKIVARNPFAPYAPPPPPARPVAKAEPAPKPSPPAFDQAKFAYLTAVVSDGAAPQAWLNVRTSGETLKLAVGESFHVGEIEATVTQILARGVVITTGGKRLLLSLGQNLREATQLADGG